MINKNLPRDICVYEVKGVVLNDKGNRKRANAFLESIMSPNLK